MRSHISYNPKNKDVAFGALKLHQKSHSVKYITKTLGISSTTFYRYIHWAKNTFDRMSYTDDKGLKVINR